MRKLTFSAAVFAVLLICRADAAQMTVWSSNGVREAFTELIPQFEKATGHRVMVTWDGTFSGGILTSAKDAAVARELLTFLRNPRNAAVLKNAGLELP